MAAETYTPINLESIFGKESAASQTPAEQTAPEPQFDRFIAAQFRLGRTVVPQVVD